MQYRLVEALLLHGEDMVRDGTERDTVHDVFTDGKWKKENEMN